MVNELEVNPGYKHTKLGWIPEEWEVVKLGEVAKVERGRFSPRPRNDPKYYGGDIPFVQTGDVTNSNGLITSHSQTLNEKGLKVSKLFGKGTILMTIASNIGHTAILGYDMACPDSLVGIIASPCTTPDYLNYYFIFTQRGIEHIAPGGQKNINIEFLNPLQLVLPPLSEQQKIAQILSAWDKAITKTKQLIRKKQEGKKGLMQQLLTGKKRFKKFVKSDKMNETRLGLIPEDWEIIELGNKIDLLSGFAFSSKKYSKHGIRLLRGANIKRGNTQWSDDISIYWNDNIESFDRYQLQKNDLVIAMDGSLVGRSYALLIEDDLPALLLQRVARIRSKELSVPFLKELVASKHFVNYCDSVKTVTAIPHISSKDIKKFKIPYPPIREQKKIASVLSIADKEISFLQDQLAKLKEQKKGLMQKLLTGEVRVHI